MIDKLLEKIFESEPYIPQVGDRVEIPAPEGKNPNGAYFGKVESVNLAFNNPNSERRQAYHKLVIQPQIEKIWEDDGSKLIVPRGELRSYASNDISILPVVKLLHYELVSNDFNAERYFSVRDLDGNECNLGSAFQG